MNIPKAIEILDRITAQDEESGRPECVEAEKLGIEALKCIETTRRDTGCRSFGKLPGETED